MQILPSHEYANIPRDVFCSEQGGRSCRGKKEVLAHVFRVFRNRPMAPFSVHSYQHLLFTCAFFAQSCSLEPLYPSNLVSSLSLVSSPHVRRGLRKLFRVASHQAVAKFPQLLCQGLGRSARVAYLLLPADAPSVMATAAAAVPYSSSSNDDGTAAHTAVVAEDAAAEETATVVAVRENEAVAAASAGASAEGKRLSAADAYREICRRVADFESDHPGYSYFLDSLLLTAGDRLGGGAGSVAGGGGAVGVSRNQESGLGVLPDGVALGQGVNGANQRQQNLRLIEPNATNSASPDGAGAASRGAAPVAVATPTAGPQTADVVPNAETRGMVSVLLQEDDSAQQQQVLNGGSSLRLASPPSPPRSHSPLASPPPHSAPTDDVRIAVRSEKALGAAMTAAAKGPGGGRAAAAMLLGRQHDDAGER